MKTLYLHEDHAACFDATIGGRASSAAATSVWNGLPEAVPSSASLAMFRKSLKTELFKRSLADG